MFAMWKAEYIAPTNWAPENVCHVKKQNILPQQIGPQKMFAM